MWTLRTTAAFLIYGSICVSEASSVLLVSIVM